MVKSGRKKFTVAHTYMYIHIYMCEHIVVLLHLLFKWECNVDTSASVVSYCVLLHEFCCSYYIGQIFGIEFKEFCVKCDFFIALHFYYAQRHNNNDNNKATLTLVTLAANRSINWTYFLLIQYIYNTYSIYI